ncbi:GntR family transcriptional regulator [Intrasporangium chromatireducens Q5-1]|uniref:GntR family transcriptional regulator n=1 Tax=Intrasporangium chromatireducens Q5-1 TaxID=584657 RepID=W9GLL8_9MICO|nr:GntR family transcriptional regulator [Intrasporangium chromatireducens]EWT05728.1 GntR family transcriptional regulator [Intrasporangium chromatireducens Q5-1]
MNTARMPLRELGADGPATLHSRISTWIRSQIASGAWPAHFRLKPEPELAAELGVSRGTLRRALSTLIEEGALVQIRGKGTFVTSTVVEPAIAQKLTSLAEDFASQGVALTTKVLRARVTVPPPAVTALLELPNRARIFELVRLRSTPDGPVALLANYVRTDLARGIEKVDFEAETLFGTLAGRYGLHITSGRRTFTATAADDVQARHLDVPAGSPLQYVEQVTYLAGGEPIEYSDVWIRSDRLRVTSMLSRR